MKYHGSLEVPLQIWGVHAPVVGGDEKHMYTTFSVCEVRGSWGALRSKSMAAKNINIYIIIIIIMTIIIEYY